MDKQIVNIHDVIQVVPTEATKTFFHAKLAIVDEVTNWGVKAHIDTFEGEAHLRLQWGSFVVIGQAVFLTASTEDSE